MNYKKAAEDLRIMADQLQYALTRRQAVKEYAQQLRNFLDFVIDNSK